MTTQLASAMAPSLPRAGTRPWQLAAGAAALGTLVVTADDEGVVLCPFRRCTGGYCPGCGGTRAANRLLRGNISGAWAHHPWVILAAVQVVVLAAVLAFVSAPARRHLLLRAAMPLVGINTVALIAIWIIRLHDGSIPTGWL